MAMDGLRIWRCKCGQYNAAGLRYCARCGQSMEVQNAGDNHSRRGDAFAEPAEQAALVGQVKAEEVLDGDAKRLLVTIERHSTRELDYDNLVGGSKQLRDAIAELLGRKGDAERDGLEFRYVQKKGAKKTVIRIEAVEYEEEQELFKDAADLRVQED